MGWERMEVPDARVAMMLPPGWYTAVPHNGDMSLGDFENLRPDSKRRSAAQAALGNSDLMRAYAQSGEYAQGGDAAVILHLTAWNDAGNIPLEDLGRVLREDRLVKGEWYEIGSVPTGLGDGQRLHYWSEWEGRAHSTVEVVFLAPDGNPYTLSVLTDAAIADRTWAEFDQVMLSLEPLAER